MRYYNEESKCRTCLADITAIHQVLVIALAVLFFDCYRPLKASSVELPRLSGMVNDSASFLHVRYAKDLEARLKRFNEKTGYAIIILIIPSGEDKQISNLIAQVFANNRLEDWGSAGVVLVLITVQEGWVIAEPSKKIEKKFLKLNAVKRMKHFYFYPRESEHPDAAVERRVEAVVEILDPWFYVLDPPYKDLNLFTRSPTAEIILFPGAPFFGFMVGMILTVFTSAGKLRALGRFLVCGFLGCVVALTAAFLVRQPGGIAPGMLYYSAGVSFVVSALIGALKPYWITETVRGRRPGEEIHPPFFGRG